MAPNKRGKGAPKRRPLKRAREVRERLEVAIPSPRVELDFQTPWQLVVATILAAQSTDKMINTVTPRLFERWPEPADLAAASQEEVEVVVKSTGFFRAKAKRIREAAQVLVERFDSVVPRDIEQLMELPGVARKTANVVIGSAYGVPSGIVVDTHVSRVSQLLRLTRRKDPVKIEADLCDLWAPEHWIGMSHRLVLHGRYVCKARSPACAECPLNELCPGRQTRPDDEDWSWRAAWERELIPGAAPAG